MKVSLVDGTTTEFVLTGFNGHDLRKCKKLFEEVASNHLRGRDTDGTKWIKRFSSTSEYNRFIKSMCDAGFFRSWTNNKRHQINLDKRVYEELMAEYIVGQPFKQFALKQSMQHYMMGRGRRKDVTIASNHSVIVSVDGKPVYHKQFDGLRRNGFGKVCGNWYYLNIEAIKLYRDQIAKLIYDSAQSTGIMSPLYSVTYDEIVHALLLYVEQPDRKYSVMDCIMDARGRAIFECIRKIFNPVSHKVARACIILPEPRPLNASGRKRLYMYVAQLCGTKRIGLTPQELVDIGRDYCNRRYIPDFCYTDPKKLHVKIKLELIYDNLEDPDNWEIPIEIDENSSVCAYYGVLTGDRDLLELVNLLPGTTYRDAWMAVPEVPRDNTKTYLTRLLYGSQQPPIKVWTGGENGDYKLSYDLACSNAVSNGVFYHANKAKDDILDTINPGPVVDVVIYDEKFRIYCSKAQYGSGRYAQANVWCSDTGQYEPAIYWTGEIPDYKAFKRYFPTCLMHNRDSWTADKICQGLDWVIPIHDSFILHPNNAELACQIGINCMRILYANRRAIMKAFLESCGGKMINIVDNAGDNAARHFSHNWFK